SPTQPQPGARHFGNGADEDIETLHGCEPAAAANNERVLWRGQTRAVDSRRRDLAGKVGNRPDRTLPSEGATALGDPRGVGDDDVVVAEMAEVAREVAQTRQLYCMSIVGNETRGARHPRHDDVGEPRPNQAAAGPRTETSGK